MTTTSLFRTALLLIAIAAPGCASDRHGGSDAAISDGSVVSQDLALADLAGDLAAVDQAAPVPDLAAADLAGPPPDLAPKPDRGQCYTDAHCGTGQTCRVEAAGGICAGCGGDTSTCPALFQDACTADVCLRSCATAAECLSGQACVGAGGSVCGQKTCSSSTQCPPYYTCRTATGGSTTFCMRVLCPGGTGCPAGTTCRSTGTSPAQVCVEDHLTF